MRILFDHGTPQPLQQFLTGHEVMRAKELGWDTLTNGELLSAAETAGFDLFLTTDKGIFYQQNLTNRKIAIVVLGNSRWSLVAKHIGRVVSAVNGAKPNTFFEVLIPDS